MGLPQHPGCHGAGRQQPGPGSGVASGEPVRVPGAPKGGQTTQRFPPRRPGFVGWWVIGCREAGPASSCYPDPWPPGLLQFPEGGERPALRASPPGDPSFPPAHPYTPSPPNPFCPLPWLPAPGWAASEVSSPPEGLGGPAGGCSPPPPPRTSSPRRGHPGAEANRPPPPACAICRLSASLRGPRSQAPAGVGEQQLQPLLPGSFPGASRPLPSLWPLAPPLRLTPPSGSCRGRLPLPSGKAEMVDTLRRKTWGGR